MLDERAKIESAARAYLDGLYEGDADKIALVFHPTSSLTWEKDGALIALSRDQWLEALRARPSAKARGLARHDEIIQVDQSSPTTGFVKLRCAVPPDFYVDYLCFLKIEGEWNVVQKVFSTKSND